MLRLECSLSTEKVRALEHYTRKVEAPAVEEEEDPGKSALHKMETKLNKVVKEVTKLSALSDRLSGLETALHSLLPKPADIEMDPRRAPLRVIRAIDYKLFDRVDFYNVLKNDETCRQVEMLLDEIGVEECDRLAAEFLSQCRPFVNGTMLGGTTLLRAALVLQGMRTDDVSTHDETQPILFGKVKLLIGTALLTSPLRVQDIEALLYMAQFNAARKPKQPILDSWLLSSYAINQFIQSFDVADILGSLGSAETKHLVKMFASLCLTNLQYAVSTFRPFSVPKTYMDFMFEDPVRSMMKAEDPYTLAELELYAAFKEGTVNSWYNNNTTLMMPADDEPKKRGRPCKKLEDGDKKLRAALLYNAYLYCKIIAVRNNTEGGEGEREGITHSMSVLKTFLKITQPQVLAMPNYPLCILLYAVMTLCDFAGEVKVESKPKSKSKKKKEEPFPLIVEVYWHLYHLGLKQRDIINSIARIIKSLVQNATNRSIEGFGIPNPPNPANVQGEAEAEGTAPSSVNGTDTELFPLETLDFPDISQYESFDDFFEGMFSYVSNMQSAISA